MLLRTATRASPTSLQEAQEFIIFSIQALLLHLLLSLCPLLWIRDGDLLLLLVVIFLLFGSLFKLARPETGLILVNYSLHRGRDALVSLSGSLANFEAAKLLEEPQTFAILVCKVCFELTLLRCILDLFFLLPQFLMAGS